MTTRRHWMKCAIATAALACGLPAGAQDDPGKAKIGSVSVIVYFGTNADPKGAGSKPGSADEANLKRLRAENRLDFKNYRVLGKDVQPLLRSYESWAQPLKPSDEILVRFEARSVPMPKL